MLSEDKNAGTADAPVAARGRAANVALWVAQVLLALAFGVVGINKLGGLQPKVVEEFALIGFGQWFRYLTGVLELAGVMASAVLAHLFVLPPPAALAAVPAFLGAVFVLIAWGRWPGTKALLGKRGR